MYIRLMNKNGLIIHFGILFKLAILPTYSLSLRDRVLWFENWHFGVRFPTIWNFLGSFYTSVSSPNGNHLKVSKLQICALVPTCFKFVRCPQTPTLLTRSNAAVINVCKSKSNYRVQRCSFAEIADLCMEMQSDKDADIVN